jgi:hypothetical protein
MLNRYGLIDTDLVDLVESDERLRRLERAAASGGPEAEKRYHQELIRQGRAGDVMSVLVRRHGEAKRAYDKARERRRWPEEITDNYHRARQNVRDFRHKHRIHPADHANLLPDESPSQFADRLSDLEQGHSWFPGSSETAHGTLTYHTDYDKDEDHIAKGDAMQRAWERNIKGGYVGRGERSSGSRRQGDWRLKGSYVNFRSDPTGRAKSPPYR